ncbi:hypothetical protein B0H12DRAFT_1231874 [Mycena haematopus]|nr:hypothetical protein B0H12DRAFT_1072889 [Mycena haematopus]KAJ7260401.1 hypothetical protein B0H12DRAFT_1231874 [Mycena haematopus]
MEKVPYIDRPLPVISTRREWRPFSSRGLPVICARMNREELVQLIGGDVGPEGDNDGVPRIPTSNEPASDKPDSRNGEPNSNETATQYDPGSAAPGGSSTSPAPNKPNSRMKPPGQPNRPGSGGYNLEKHLAQNCGWTHEGFLEVQNKVHVLAEEKLDISLSYQKQPKRTINSICEAVKQEHAIARGFDQCWVIKDMLIVYLKNTSETARRRKTRRKEGETGVDD